MIDPLDVTLLKPFADAFKALQRVSSTAGDNETNVGIFREIAISYFHTSQVVVILSLEPSLLMWFIHDFSPEASYLNAHVLLEMTMTMRERNYGSLEDLKSALNDWKNHAYYRFNGNGRLMELHNEIGFAMMNYCTYGTVPHLGVFDNEYTKCLDIFGLGIEDSEDSKQFSSLEN
ncbi:hypothetical protein CAEBREN_23583 [Caenorhabditis brenneri]|uniref:Uncharacterized protein n=1 Tax=Caenorhabditis brenneri TaxID=135651 RepID=G0NVX9_CAEBE|nr:hypothetical protein CAEBREN_23583 [Caenorhabditis brenneri]